MPDPDNQSTEETPAATETEVPSEPASWPPTPKSDPDQPDEG